MHVFVPGPCFPNSASVFPGLPRCVPSTVIASNASGALSRSGVVVLFFEAAPKRGCMIEELFLFSWVVQALLRLELSLGRSAVPTTRACRIIIHFVLWVEEDYMCCCCSLWFSTVVLFRGT